MRDYRQPSFFMVLFITGMSVIISILSFMSINYKAYENRQTILIAFLFGVVPYDQRLINYTRWFAMLFTVTFLHIWSIYF